MMNLLTLNINDVKGLKVFCTDNDEGMFVDVEGYIVDMSNSDGTVMYMVWMPSERTVHPFVFDDLMDLDEFNAEEVEKYEQWRFEYEEKRLLEQIEREMAQESKPNNQTKLDDAGLFVLPS